MRKITEILLAALLCLALPLTALAEEITGCTVTVDSAAGAPGETVTVAVRMGDNPGFTNFAIALDYDPAQLTLKSMETKDGDSPYLCGAQVSTNTAWEKAEQTFGYVVSAASDAVKEDGILFTATFEIAEDFTGEAEILPVVQYVRNNEALFSVFEEIHAEVTLGVVTSVLAGDVNGDGVIEYDDVMLAYRAFLGEAELTSAQLAVVDSNGNGTVEEAEYQAIYEMYLGG